MIVKIAAAALALALAPPAFALDAAKLTAAVKAEEARLGARIGAALVEEPAGVRWSYRGDERFPLDSTHKAFACAALLAKVDNGEASLETPTPIARADLVPNSPITEKLSPGQPLNLGQLCGAAIGVSDNSAANAILGAIGGPPGVTALFRALGDPISQLDRRETELNEATPGDPRDTTTPERAAIDLDKLLLGETLKPASRDQLRAWMEADSVAGALLRARLPAGWRIADKTGAGGHGSRGIVAMIWPPQRPALTIAIYLSETDASLDQRNGAIARIGAALFTALSP